MDILYKSVLFGFLIGIILSILVSVFGLKQINTYTIYGISFEKLFAIITLIGLIITICILSTVSIIIHDIEYPVNHPIAFTIETLVISFLFPIIYLLTIFLRGGSVGKIEWIEFFALTLKFGILHLLLEFSGIYHALYNTKK